MRIRVALAEKEENQEKLKKVAVKNCNFFQFLCVLAENN